MKHKLNIGYVKKLPFTSGQTEIWDTELAGFGVRVSATKKTFFVKKRIGKKQCRVNIGDSSFMNADDARKKAMEIILQMSEGVDVNRERRKAQKRGIKLSEAMEAFFTARTQLKERTVQTYKDLMRLYLADWLNKPLADISPDMCAKRHLKIGREHGRACADNTFRTFRIFYNFARTIEDLPENPVKRLSVQRQWFRVERRQTVIKPSELPDWYDAVNRIENPIIKGYLLLCLFTGLRRSEAARLRWSDVDFDEGVFTITDTKNKKPHTVFITEPVRDILHEQADIRQNDFVFWGSGKAGHINDPSRQRRNIAADTGIEFCVHDLRRTFASIAEGAVSYSVLKKLLNHIDGNDVTQGYLILSDERMMSETSRVTSVIMNLCKPPAEGGKVIPFRKAS